MPPLTVRPLIQVISVICIDTSLLILFENTWTYCIPHTPQRDNSLHSGQHYFRQKLESLVMQGYNKPIRWVSYPAAFILSPTVSSAESNASFVHGARLLPCKPRWIVYFPEKKNINYKMGLMVTWHLAIKQGVIITLCFKRRLRQGNLVD